MEDDKLPEFDPSKPFEVAEDKQELPDFNPDAPHDEVKSESPDGISDANKAGYDAALGFRESLPFSGILDKIGSAQMAGVQEIGDLFRDEKDRKSFADRYNEYNKGTIKDYAEASVRSPVLNKVGYGTGILTSLATPTGVIGTGVKGATGAATRVGSTMAQSVLDSATRGEDLIDTDAAKKAATVSGGIQAGIEAIPVVGKVAAPAAKYLGEKIDDVKDFLDRFGSRRAAKAAGAMTKEIKKFREESNEAQRIYNAMRRKDPSLPKKRIDKLAEFGDELVQEGIVKFGTDIDNIATDVNNRFDVAADKLSNNLSELDEAAVKSNVAGAGISDNEVADEIEKYLVEKYKNTRADKSKAAAIQAEVDLWRSGGDVRRSLPELNTEKATYDKYIDYRNVTATEKPLMEAKKEVRQIINSVIEKKADQVAEEVGNTMISKGWKDSKKDFGKIARIKDTMESRMATIEASNLISLRDTAVGTGIGGLYAAGTQDPISATAAIPAAIITGALRKRGTSSSAVAAKGLASGIGKAKSAVESAAGLAARSSAAPVAQTITRATTENKDKEKAIEDYLRRRYNE